MHWNKGSSILANKLDDIETIVEEQAGAELDQAQLNLGLDFTSTDLH